jgi:hypothetical protein
MSPRSSRSASPTRNPLEASSPISVCIVAARNGCGIDARACASNANSSSSV